MRADSENSQWRGYRSRYSDDKHELAQAIYTRDSRVEPRASNYWMWRRPSENLEWSWFNYVPAKGPAWAADCEYRYLPSDTVEWFETPDTDIGKQYWCINLCAPDGLHEGIWESSPQQREWRARGLVFWDHKSALQVARVLINQVRGYTK